MKRIIALGLAILMILSLCACGNGNQPAASNAASAESAAAQGGETALQFPLVKMMLPLSLAWISRMLILPPPVGERM